VTLDEAYREHAPLLFRYLVRLTGDAELAADVVQDTFLRFAETPPLTPQPRGWLYRVATNLARERQRSAGRRLRLLLGRAARVPVGDAPAPPDLLLEQREAREAVRAALDALPERDRAILLMRADGLAYAEIAQALGTTTQSVGTMLIRALKKLSRKLPLGGAGHR
jgi:RNA polymerase sigma factor (sigma-70 family)